MAQWTTVQNNVTLATTTAPGIIQLATDGEVNTGTDTQKAVVPSSLTAWTGSTNISTVGTITSGVWSGTTIVAGKLPSASTTASGIVEVATQTEVNTGTDTLRTVSPATLANATIDGGTF